MPKNIDSLISFSTTFSREELNGFALHLGNQHVKEVLHLFLRLAKPLNKKNKFDSTEMKRLALNSDTISEMINEVDYSKITS